MKKPGAARAPFRFQLYVAGNTPNSAHALANLTALCHKYLAGRHEIEVVDVFEQPQRALAERIFMTPTLVKMAPVPAQRVVGTLSKVQTVLQALGVPEAQAA
jgi:circadian clock protein KaiB